MGITHLQRPKIKSLLISVENLHSFKINIDIVYREVTDSLGKWVWFTTFSCMGVSHKATRVESRTLNGKDYADSLLSRHAIFPSEGMIA